MHIVVLLTEIFDKTGGIQAYGRCLTLALGSLAQEKGWKVTLLSLNDKGSNPLQEKYIKNDAIKYLGFSGNKIKFSLAALKYAGVVDKMIVGHINFLLLGCLAKIINSKLVSLLIVHGIDVWKKFSFIQNRALDSVDRILSVSQYTQSVMAKMNSLSGDKFYVLPNTLDPLLTNSMLNNAKDVQLPKGKIILSVSRLDYSDRYKNIDLVIKAMPNILQHVPDAYYVVVGGGDDKERLMKLALKERVQDKVWFVGNVSQDELCGYYEACDVFALPSTGEGFGIVFLEAMYYKKPCVGVWSSAVPEVVNDGQTGILCEVGNGAALEESLVKLLKDGDMRKNLGGMGYEKLQREFMFDAFQSKLEQVLCK